MTQGPVEQLCTASILNLPWLLLVWLRGLSDQFCTFGRASFFPGKWPLELINCGEIGHHPTLNKNYFSKAQRLRHHPGLHATDVDFSSPAAPFCCRNSLFCRRNFGKAAPISRPSGSFWHRRETPPASDSMPMSSATNHTPF